MREKMGVSGYLIALFSCTVEMGKKYILLKIHRIYTFS